MAKTPRRTRASKGKRKAHREFRNAPTGLASARRDAASVAAENQRLRRRGTDLEKELDRCQAALSQAVAQEVGADNLLAQRFVATELQHGDLVSLYVASSRLHTTLRRQDVLGAIREIVINLIGAEEMAVFEVDPPTSTLSLMDCYGSGAANDLKIRVGKGPIGSVAVSGECYFGNGDIAGQKPGDEHRPTACVPLKVDGLVFGVIVIVRLLPQKEGLTALDYQLLELLSTQAGIALYCAKLRSEQLANAEFTA